MEELETTWIDTKKCAEQSNSPATLGLNHMLGMNCRFDLAPVVQKLDSAIHRIITIQWISVRESDCAIEWIEIYPVDSAIHRINHYSVDKY